MWDSLFDFSPGVCLPSSSSSVGIANYGMIATNSDFIDNSLVFFIYSFLILFWTAHVLIWQVLFWPFFFGVVLIFPRNFFFSIFFFF